MTFPTEPITLNDPVLDAQAQFAADTADHVMTVLHDDGHYKHLRFRNRQSNFYWYEISTIPGMLTITGDMGTFTFRRETNMMDWFWGSKGGINPHYWAQKMEGSDAARQYSPDVFKQSVTAAFLEIAETMDDGARADLWQAIEEHILPEAGYEVLAREALDDFYHDGTVFEDTGDWAFEEYTSHYLWSLFAIVHAIRVYRSQPAAGIAA